MEIVTFAKTLYWWYNDKGSKYTKKEKRDCINTYICNRIDFFAHLIIAPLVYPIYYINRNTLNQKLFIYSGQNRRFKTIHDFELWLSNTLRYGPVYNRRLCINAINKLSPLERFLWYSGDIVDVDKTGGTPVNYKPKLPMFIRRWFYSAIRNPFYNRVWAKYVRGPIRYIDEVLDERTDIDTSNFGTGNHRVGKRFRVYWNNSREIMFYYEHTYKSRLLGWRTHYSGAVGLSDKGVDDLDFFNYYFVWYEHSNRPCKIIEN